MVAIIYSSSGDLENLIKFGREYGLMLGRKDMPSRVGGVLSRAIGALEGPAGGWAPGRPACGSNGVPRRGPGGWAPLPAGRYLAGHRGDVRCCMRGAVAFSRGPGD